MALRSVAHVRERSAHRPSAFGRESNMRACRWVFVVALTGIAGADWPEWLSPRRDGYSPESLNPWASSPRVIWKQRVGDGHGSPVVANGRVYLLATVPYRGTAVLLAFDAETGWELWKSAYVRGPFKSIFGSGPRSTPALETAKFTPWGPPESFAMPTHRPASLCGRLIQLRSSMLRS